MKGLQVWIQMQEMRIWILTLSGFTSETDLSKPWLSSLQIGRARRAFPGVICGRHEPMKLIKHSSQYLPHIESLVHIINSCWWWWFSL